VGRNVGPDLYKLVEDYKLNVPKNFEELGKLAVNRGCIEDGREGLSSICQSILGKQLKKDESIRYSDWRSNLSNEQLKYAALDAYCSFKIFKQLQQVNPVLREIKDKDSCHIGMPVKLNSTLSNSRVIALGTISALSGNWNNYKISKGRVVVKVIAVINPDFELKYPLGDKKYLGEYISENQNEGFEILVDIRTLRGHSETTWTQSAVTQVIESASRKQSRNSREIADEIFVRPMSNAIHYTSRVKLDAWHAMDRIYLPQNHAMTAEFRSALRDAIFKVDSSDYERLARVLQMKNIDIKKVKETNWKYFARRVRRVIPEPKELGERVRMVIRFYRDKRDKLLGDKPLFYNDESIASAKSLLNHIDLGCLSDHPDVQLYTKIGEDADGLPLYHCVRGTSGTESVHQKLIKRFSAYSAGPRFTDALLREHRHRHNLRQARKYMYNYPNFGHYSTEIIDKIQLLHEKIYSELRYPSWDCTLDFNINQKESFGVGPLDIDESDFFNDEKNAQEDEEDSLSLEKPQTNCKPKDSIEFLEIKMKTKTPLLPICTDEEVRLWWKLLPKYLRCDDNSGNIRSPNFVSMVKEWNTFLERENIHKKLACHLQSYYTKYFKKIISKRLSIGIGDREESIFLRQSLQDLAECLPPRNSTLNEEDTSAFGVEEENVHTSDTSLQRNGNDDDNDIVQASDNIYQPRSTNSEQSSGSGVSHPLQSEAADRSSINLSVISARGDPISLESFIAPPPTETSKPERRKETGPRRPRLCRYPDVKAVKICGSTECNSSSGCRFKDQPELWIPNPGPYKRKRR
jgi:hypothetical protein